MKVFLSWSGETSHKVAMVFRDWLPAVIQSLIPYVSSEDIDKGARWSTDIASELDDSTFGILCVTKQNIHAPWLNFEAGALSKTMNKSYVTPFLFDVKRSEVNGPILQFQSTVFDKEDVKKLIDTLNKACGDSQLKDALLEKAFDVWWPSLQEKLLEIGKNSGGNAPAKEIKPSPESNILEEILDISRTNQKLLRSSEMPTSTSLDVISNKLDSIAKDTQNKISLAKIEKRKFHPGAYLELAQNVPPGRESAVFKMILSNMRADFPWIYDGGVELCRYLEQSHSLKQKSIKINEFITDADYFFNQMRSPFFMELDRFHYPAIQEPPFILREVLHQTVGRDLI